VVLPQTRSVLIHNFGGLVDLIFEKEYQMVENYDVIVIGAGPGGYVAAIKSAQLGLKTAIIDKQWLGGVCLNVGCIPSKSLLRNAEIAHTLRERGKEFGFSFDNLKLDFAVAVKRSRQVSDRLVKGVGFLMKKNGISVIMGTAKLTSPTTIAVTDKGGKLTELSAKTSSSPQALHLPSPAHGKWTSKKLLPILKQFYRRNCQNQL
jgi:dihydrolipoamide dehydrogenase